MLSSVTLPSNLTVIPFGAFNGCSSLKTITIPDNVTSIGSAAFSSSGLTEITIPKNVKNIAGDAFDSTNIADFVVSEENDYFAAVDGVLFNKTLDSIVKYPKAKTSNNYVIPNGVNKIYANAFYYCTNLESITIPDSVSFIGQYAFCGCSKLNEINLPSSLTSINTGTFIACEGLTKITIPEKVDSIANDAFERLKQAEIQIDKEKNSISGSPWGADKSTVIKWKGEF